MLKAAKGAALAEIMATAGWQAHTVRGFVSILGSKGGEKIESSKKRRGRANVPHCQVAALPLSHCFEGQVSAMTGSGKYAESESSFLLLRRRCLTDLRVGGLACIDGL
jgi:hypothetical protein